MGDETSGADEFAQVMGSAFGLQERFVGPEMHQAMVKRAEAETEMNIQISAKIIEQADAKAKIYRQIAGSVAIINLLLLAGGITGLVRWWTG